MPNWKTPDSRVRLMGMIEGVSFLVDGKLAEEERLDAEGRII